MKKAYYMSKLLILTLFSMISGIQIYAQKSTSSKPNPCSYILEKYSESWKLDSVGKNGLREILATELLGKCKFVGSQWKKISTFLGPPKSLIFPKG
jgi:hypothetical protein